MSRISWWCVSIKGTATIGGRVLVGGLRPTAGPVDQPLKRERPPEPLAGPEG